MGGKRSRQAGDRWEREVVKELDGKRQPSSGAFGTAHKMASLTGDVVVQYPWWNHALHIECKYGYGGSSSLSLKREWFTKVRQEAERANRIPVIAIKYRDVTSGDRESAKVVCINFDHWKVMMRELEYLYLEYLSLLKEKYERENND